MTIRVKSGQPMATPRPPSLSIAILAAGVGKRMRSGLPKVLHPLGGRPLLAPCARDGAQARRQIASASSTAMAATPCASAFPTRICAGRCRIRRWAPGHALAQALPQLAADGVTLVLFGADPLARAETLEAVVRHARARARCRC